MKKWLLLIGILLLVSWIKNGNTPAEDAGELEPVQLLVAEWTEGKLRLRTDNGYEGWGDTVQKALADLKESAPVKLFLDTADYLLVRKNALPCLEELMDALRPSCSIATMAGAIEPAEAVKYLASHVPQTTIAMYRAGKRTLSQLWSEEGRMKLVPG